MNVKHNSGAGEQAAGIIDLRFARSGEDALGCLSCQKMVDPFDSSFFVSAFPGSPLLPQRASSRRNLGVAAISPAETENAQKLAC